MSTVEAFRVLCRIEPIVDREIDGLPFKVEQEPEPNALPALVYEGPLSPRLLSVYGSEGLKEHYTVTRLGMVDAAEGALAVNAAAAELAAVNEKLGTARADLAATEHRLAAAQQALADANKRIAEADQKLAERNSALAADAKPADAKPAEAKPAEAKGKPRA